MKPDDRKKFLEVVLGFAELKGKQLSAPALELYWRAMQDWDIADFQATAAQLVRTCEFMPTPKDFEDVRKNLRPTCGEAWSLVLDHCRSSRYRYEPLGIPLVDTVVRSLGGYQAIAMHDESTLHFLERRFAEHYETMQESIDTREGIAHERLRIGLDSGGVDGENMTPAVGLRHIGSRILD